MTRSDTPIMDPTTSTDRTVSHHRTTTALPSLPSASIPPGFVAIHLAPATHKTVVTTTTTTTVSFPPVLIPRPPSPRLLVESDPRADGGNASSSRAWAGRGRTALEGHGVVIDADGVERLDSKLYPLAGAELPEEWIEKGFALPMGDNGFPTRFDCGVSALETPVGTTNLAGKGKAKEVIPDSSSPIHPTTTLTNKLRRAASRKRPTLSPATPNLLPLPGTSNSPPPEETPPRKRPRLESEMGPGEPESALLAAVKSHHARTAAPRQGEGPGQAATAPATTSQPGADFPPSPMLSPGLQAVRNPGDEAFAVATLAGGIAPASPADSHAAGEGIGEAGETGVQGGSTEHPAVEFRGRTELATLVSLPDLMHEFTKLPQNLQQYTLFNLLRLSSTPVLQWVHDLVGPALRRDFVADLPPEIAVIILSHLSGPTLCRASRVSKEWRRLIDGEWRVWKDRLIHEGLWIGDGSEEPDAIRCLRAESGEVDRRSDFARRWEAGVWETAGEDRRQRSRVRSIGWEGVVGGGRRGWNTLDPLLDPLIVGGPKAVRNKEWDGGIASPQSQEEDANDATTRPVQPWDDKEMTLTPEGLFREAHFTHKYKYLYRKRYLTRTNWARVEPKRIKFAGHGTNVVTCLQFDREKIISASDDQSINVFDMRKGTRIKSFDGHEGGVWALQYLGNTLVTGSTDRSVRIWEIDSGRNTHTFLGHTSTVRCLQIVEPVNVNPVKGGAPIWEPPYPVIVTGSRDWLLRVWKLPSPNDDWYRAGQPHVHDEATTIADPAANPYHLHWLDGHKHAVRALSAHGKTMVSGSYDCTVRVWNIVTGKCHHVMQGHTQKVYSVVIDPARKQCASGSMDHTVRLWDIENGVPLQVLDGHSSLVGLLGLSHRNLVSAAADSTLRIWDPDTGACRQQLIAHSGAITCFQHDNHKIVSGSDGTMKMWDIVSPNGTGGGDPGGRDLLTGLTGVWQVDFDDRFCVAAVQRNNASEFEILDFGRTDGRTDAEEEEKDRLTRAKVVKGKMQLVYGRHLGPCQAWDGATKLKSGDM